MKANLELCFLFHFRSVFHSLICICRQLLDIIKRPARDACLCMGELPAPPAPAAPPAPHFVFLITL